MRVLIFLLFFSSSANALPLPEATYPFLLTKYHLNPLTQSFCYEDEAGQVLGSNIDQKVIPASVTKAYTTYVALKKFGPSFRFKTLFEIHSNSSGNRLQIIGDHDGYFLNDQIFYVLNLLQDSGISQLNEILFDSKFFLNFNLDPALIRADLMNLFQTTSWNPELKEKYASFVKRAQKLGLQVSPSIPKMNVSLVKSGNPFEGEAARTFEVQSLPLLRLLKDMNVHSTNRFAKSVFLRINNTSEFNQILYQDLNTDETKMKFHDGSGGQSNYTTCRVTLQLFKSLENLLNSYDYRFDDVISVAGMDGGTLRNRFNQPGNSGAVMGKTGTLPDIGVSTLAGKISTQSGNLYYGIFNRYPVPNLDLAKGLQNGLVDELLKAHFGKKEIEHQAWSFDVLDGLQVF